MKSNVKKYKLICAVVIVAVSVSACSFGNDNKTSGSQAIQNNEKKNNDSNSAPPVSVQIPELGLRDVKEYTVDTEASRVEWQGRYLQSGKAHSGTVKVKNGKFETVGNGLTGMGGYFDMASISDQNIPDESPDPELITFLRSPALLDVEKYPEAFFRSTSVAKGEDDGNYKITGDLTIKDVTNKISFPLNVTISGRQLTGAAEVTIDLTEWSINNGSDTQDQDRAISNLVTFDFRVVGNL